MRFIELTHYGTKISIVTDKITRIMEYEHESIHSIVYYSLGHREDSLPVDQAREEILTKIAETENNV